MSRMIASAVIVPDDPVAPPDTTPSPQRATKRRQYSISEGDSKRPRLSREPSERAVSRPPSTGPAEKSRPKTLSGEERQRGRRLFGSILGTLSQSSGNASQRRRADIERKQQAKIKQQAQEDAEAKKKRLEQLKAVRRREQKKFEEQAMRTKHQNLLATANFLQTKTEPRVYYLPFELRPHEEDKIRDQLIEAEATIEAEVRRFEERNGTKHTQTNGQNNRAEEVIDDAMSIKAVGSEPPANKENPALLQNGSSNHDSSTQMTISGKDGGEDNGEAVLEDAEEDAIVY